MGAGVVQECRSSTIVYGFISTGVQVLYRSIELVQYYGGS
jgi:hypothetical protein